MSGNRSSVLVEHHHPWRGAGGVPGAAGNSPRALHVVLLALLLPPLAWLEVLEGEGVHLGAPLGQHGQELGDRGGCHWGWVL